MCDGESVCVIEKAVAVGKGAGPEHPSDPRRGKQQGGQYNQSQNEEKNFEPTGHADSSFYKMIRALNHNGRKKSSNPA